MAEYRVKGPDGKTHIFTGPEGATQEQVNAFAQKTFAELGIGKQKQSAPQRQATIKDPATAAMDTAKSRIFDLASGAATGAANIGATLVSPGDYIADTLLGRGDKSRAEMRRAAINEGLPGADTGTAASTIGKVGAELAGTAGIGPLIGGALLKAVPGFAPLAEAISTGGASGGPITARALGGAITGGASVGLIDPEQAGTGAAVGGGLPIAIPVAGAVARGLGRTASEGLGLSTGTGSMPIREAAKAGMEGGKRQEMFTANMRGDAEMQDALDAVKSNMEAMRAAKNQQYRSGMVDIKSDKSVLDFAGIDKAISDAANVTQFKGQVKNAKAEQIRAEIAQAVNDWKNLDPAEYHTPEGLDALKQTIGAIVEKVPFEEKTAAKVGNDIYNAVKASIVNQAPKYAEVMRDYSRAENEIREIERALSVGKKASVDTAMRKLQSLTRNNVNTNYGNRLNLAEQLQEQGGEQFIPALAGQAMSSYTPRGLANIVASGTGLAGGGAALAGSPAAALAIPALAAQSPRLVGEAALAAGKTARLNRELARLLLESRAAPVLYASGGQ